MSESKQALALHVAGGSEPLLVAVSAETAQELLTRLPKLIEGGAVHTVATANGASFVVNFAHVVAAHIDEAPPLGQLYGSPKR
jgi:CO dehydrogenase/acetyl-CoA synthase epsilon subunit